MADIGQILGGRYRLIELLGQGGMATIYRATDSGLGRDVALKLLRFEYLRDPDFSSRFRQEAQAAASLSHPNVVTVYDYGEDPSGPFIVMELIDGEDLATILARSAALPPRQAARIAAAVARALGAAHSSGIVHRDVKPGNVLIGRDGRVKVVDFGIARAVAEAQVTLPGTTLGSVHYFSPEQARGEPTTAASDIYSLGIVLYELLTGVRPWTGDSAAAVALARLSGPAPDPLAIRPTLPVDLAAIARVALSPSPDDRFSSADVMADELEATLANLSGSAGGAAAVTGDAVAPVKAEAVADLGAAEPAAVVAEIAAGETAAGEIALERSASTEDGEPSDATEGAEADERAGASELAEPGAGSPGKSAQIPPARELVRPNPSHVPYPPEAYAGDQAGDEDDDFDALVDGEPSPAGPAARSRREREVDDGASGGGVSPLVWLTGIIAIALLAAIALLVYQFASGAGSAPDPSVGPVSAPNFIGDHIADATVEARALGITLTVTDVELTSAQGTILDQDPAAGNEIPAGGEVRVSVATPLANVQIPDLRARTERDAITLLFAAGLTPGLVTEAFDPIVPEGLIVGQSPPALASVPRGSAVDYTISTGPEPTPSPSPTPTPSPSPSPSPTPSEPTPTPTSPPEPTAEPTPTPSPEPTPEPTPELTPEPTPTPT